MKPPSCNVNLRALFELFSDAQSAEPPHAQAVSRDELPAPFQRLLAHENHMTWALEEFHGRPVELRVLAVRHRQNEYARMILLALEGTDRIVEFGIMRLNFSFLSDEVRCEILARSKPLGRILIEHDVLRRIQPTAFLKITPNERLLHWFGLSAPQPIYGRLATIRCNGEPAIDLLEVVTVPAS